MWQYGYVIFGIIGAVIGAFIPDITLYLIKYKCKQRNRSQPDMQGLKKGVFRISIILFTAAVSIAVSLITSVWESVFLMIFIIAAIITAITDHYIRLIPNEYVLFLFVIGLIYRIIRGGGEGVLNSLAAFGISLLFFGGSAAVFYLIKKQSGIGAGDIKLAMAVSIIVGYPGVLYFILGSALAMMVYILFIMRMHMFNMQYYFPMAAHLCIGFFIALMTPYFYEGSLIVLR